MTTTDLAPTTTDRRAPIPSNSWPADSSAPASGPSSCATSTWASTSGSTASWPSRRRRRPSWPPAPAATSATCASGCRRRPSPGSLDRRRRRPGHGPVRAGRRHLRRVRRRDVAGLPGRPGRRRSPRPAACCRMLVDAYRTGAGVPYAAYGPDAVERAVGAEPPGVRQLPGRRVAAAAARRAGPAAGHRTARPGRRPRLRHRLGRDRAGQGLPAHRASTGGTTTRRRSRAARANAADHGVADRVSLEVVDLADESADWSPRYDVVAVRRMRARLPAPVEALRARARRACGPAVRCWSWTNGPPRRSPPRVTRSSGSSPRPARSGACRRAGSAPTRNRSAP